MDRRSLTIFFSIALIVCFFLPFFGQSPFTVSGYDMVFKSGDAEWQKYLLLLSPIGGILLLIGAINRGNYILGRGFLTWLPFIGLLGFVIWMKMETEANIGDLAKSMGYGYWISLLAAVFLAFYNPRSR